MVIGILVIMCLCMLYSKKNIIKMEDCSLNKNDILMQEYIELRGELKQRISQRDSYCAQCIIFMSAMITAAVSTRNAWVAILIPVIMDFYCLQIFESYSVHERLVEFIREQLEKRIASQVGENKSEFLWESYCEKERDLTLKSAIGGRKQMFSIATLVTPLLTGMIVFWITGNLQISLVTASIAEVIALTIVIRDKKSLHYTGLNKLSYCDYLRKADRTDEPTKAIFFDKDGTLHEDKVMTHRWRDLVLLPGAREIVKKYHDEGYLVIIVTNQSAIGKGIYSKETMHRFIWLLRKKLKYVDAVYYCPHKFGVECRCRKPGTGMFERAAKELNVDLTKSIMVGDRMSDVDAGKAAGVGRCVLVQTGLYNEDVEGVECVSSLNEI